MTVIGAQDTSTVLYTSFYKKDAPLTQGGLYPSSGPLPYRINLLDSFVGACLSRSRWTPEDHTTRPSPPYSPVRL